MPGTAVPAENPGILMRLEGVKETLESLHHSGFDLADDITAVDEAIALITLLEAE